MSGRVGKILPCLLAAAAGCASVSPASIRRAEDVRAADSRALRRALASEDPGLRARSVQAMGRIQAPGYAAALTAALQDPDARVRAQAAFALGQLRIDD